MKNINLFRLLMCLMVLLSLFSNPTSAHACSCAPFGTPAESFNNSDAIFSGRVLEIKDTSSFIYNFLIRVVRKLEISPMNYSRYVERYNGIDVTFTVTNSWKLVNTNSIKVRTGYGDADCGFSFEVDKEYLVYANYAYGETGNYLYSSICSRTNQISEATEDVAFLNTIPTIPLLTLVPSQIFSTAILMFYLLLAGFLFLHKQNKKKHPS